MCLATHCFDCTVVASHRYAPRETMLADLPRLNRKAIDLGRINILEGTKATRRIAVADHVRKALEFAEQGSLASSRDLIAAHERDLSFLPTIIRPARDNLYAPGLKGLHELRAA